MLGAPRFRFLCALLACLVAGTTLAGCGGSKSTGSSARTVDIVVTSAKCTPEPSTVAPGVVAFTVTDKGSSSVTEVELHQPDGYLLAEQSNLSGAVRGGFSATLSDGTYRIYCPGASQTTANLTVSGISTGSSWKQDPQLVQALASFTQWVSAQMPTLVTATSAFANAVKAGDLTQAEELYVPAREDFEAIEPESETFANLYLDIDGQIESFGNPTQFQGFHELEEAMWVGDSLAGQAGDAQELLGDVEQLKTLLVPVTYQPAQIVDFAYSQLTEATSFVLSGAEERYSNLELVDLKGAYDGASEAETLLAPALAQLSPSALHGLQTALSGFANGLAQCAQSPGEADSGYESYAQVGTSQRQSLYDDIANVITAFGRAASFLP